MPQVAIPAVIGAGASIIGGSMAAEGQKDSARISAGASVEAQRLMIKAEEEAVKREIASLTRASDLYENLINDPIRTLGQSEAEAARSTQQAIQLQLDALNQVNSKIGEAESKLSDPSATFSDAQSVLSELRQFQPSIDTQALKAAQQRAKDLGGFTPTAAQLQSIDVNQTFDQAQQAATGLSRFSSGVRIPDNIDISSALAPVGKAMQNLQNFENLISEPTVDLTEAFANSESSISKLLDLSIDPSEDFGFTEAVAAGARDVSQTLAASGLFGSGANIRAQATELNRISGQFADIRARAREQAIQGISQGASLQSTLAQAKVNAQQTLNAQRLQGELGQGNQYLQAQQTAGQLGSQLASTNLQSQLSLSGQRLQAQQSIDSSKLNAMVQSGQLSQQVAQGILSGQLNINDMNVRQQLGLNEQQLSALTSSSSQFGNLAGQESQMSLQQNQLQLQQLVQSGQMSQEQAQNILNQQMNQAQFSLSGANVAGQGALAVGANQASTAFNLANLTQARAGLENERAVTLSDLLGRGAYGFGAGTSTTPSQYGSPGMPSYMDPKSGFNGSPTGGPTPTPSQVQRSVQETNSRLAANPQTSEGVGAPANMDRSIVDELRRRWSS